MTRADLDEFVAGYRSGDRNNRQATWSEATPEGRWRPYTYEEALARDKVSRDHFWLRDESLEDSASLPEPLFRLGLERALEWIAGQGIDALELPVSALSNHLEGQLLLGPHHADTDAICAGTFGEKAAFAAARLEATARLAHELEVDLVVGFVGCEDYSCFFPWPDPRAWEGMIPAFQERVAASWIASTGSGCASPRNPIPSRWSTTPRQPWRASSCSRGIRAGVSTSIPPTCCSPTWIRWASWLPTHRPATSVTGRAGGAGTPLPLGRRTWWSNLCPRASPSA